MKILIVDDEIEILNMLTAYLTYYQYDVIKAQDGKKALQEFYTQQPDLVLLDWMLPDMDGITILKEMQKEKNTPVIMLTAKVKEEDLIQGMSNGADDYITKPFSPKELVVRIEALLRRVYPNGKEKYITTVDHYLKIDEKNHLIYVNQKETKFTAFQYDLLLLFMKNPKRIFTREELIVFTKGIEFQGLDRTIDSHIKNIRQKIEPYPKEPRWIETVHGKGYRFNNGEKE